MLRRVLLLFNTVKYLKFIQIKYQIYYKVRNKIRNLLSLKFDYSKTPPVFEIIRFDNFIQCNICYNGLGNFSFLNLTQDFGKDIDWDFIKYGKLWTYNLNYFDFLNQPNADQYGAEFKILIDNYISSLPALKNGNEPFPTSIRVMNWIKYFIKNQNKDTGYLKSLYSQLYLLKDNLEYHLLGNHLLENGFALTMGGVFFQDNQLFEKGKKILVEELNEQILDDGGHFELSPMYHCLMLHRVLDLSNLLDSNAQLIEEYLGNQKAFQNKINEYASKMCSWLRAVMYEDGSLPHFNDSIDGIAPAPIKLLEYAESLNIAKIRIELGDSGYRRLQNKKFDLIIKTGKIGPDYIPGHAHADTFTFELRIDNKPFIVDMGISTYEKNSQRHLERSTNSHNTVMIDWKNSSEVWGGFRVGKRVYGQIVNQSTDMIEMSYQGRATGLHKRKITLSDNYLEIEDYADPSTDALACFHFHPNISFKRNNGVFDFAFGSITYSDYFDLTSTNYMKSQGFNRLNEAAKNIIWFNDRLTTKIICA
ncbi:MAG: alginate lyase family protein [Saprospiraceae bacterium]|nr:alginate lyase family protein [Saprospiraceae bacterium]